ncbi:MAG: gamma-glutamyl-gamma-aminobutyrate hydrolase family protein [Lentisphaeria bacterium]|nr:gamma-glutamyl-gamma-aminobutyrate hydrolase family protein [Lentisphaeria bacterium]
MKSKDHPPVILLNMAVDVINGRENEVLISQYAQRVSDSGAVPMLMPSIERPEMMETLLDLADGVILIGGRDYDAREFGEEPHPEAGRNRLRPHCDIVFARLALARPIPILGICAGCQLLNIVTGGKLIQHLPNVDEHRFTTHTARVTADGYFARAVGAAPGSGLTVNSFHHQAVHPGALGRGIRVTAEAFDGSIEAVELEGSRMVLGVQFHPERMDELAPGFFNLLKEEAFRCRKGL